MHFARIVLAIAWIGDSMRLPDRVLEPGEQISEILFGLIMALTVTGVCRQNISDGWLGNLREYLAHLV